MRLSTKSLYGVKAVFDIAYNSEGYPVQIKDISKRQKISPRYLEQIFQGLKRADVLKGKRGPQGGYYLTRNPCEITVGDVLRATEDLPELVSCISEKIRRECDHHNECVTRFVWQEACSKIFEYFDSISIQDLCKRGEALGIERKPNPKIMFFQ